MTINSSELAINGGLKLREKPLPYRKLFGEAELSMVKKVFEDCWQVGVDFGYQGKYEELYTKKFCEFQRGGFADAVSSGSAAVYISLRALQIDVGSDVIISPITDPGSVSAVILNGMNPVIADSKTDDFNIGADEFETALTPKTHAAVLTHLGGHPIDIDAILDIANSKGIKIVEDCSQAHGALYKKKRVGRFGDVAAFSTMFSKNHATGGCGGVVYTENEEYYWLIRSLADRGKPFHYENFDPKNSNKFLFPALNFNLDELSCAIGYSTLSRLQNTIETRYKIAQKIDNALKDSSVVHPCKLDNVNCNPSLYFHTVQVDIDKLKVSKKEFAEAVAAEGIWVNPHYQFLVSEWGWLNNYLNEKPIAQNAKKFIDKTFNILFNENFSDQDIEDIINCILKVESVLAK